MSHVRAQIVAYLAARLTGLATTGSSVYTSRPEDMALESTALPALLIYADSESDVASPTIAAWPLRMERTIDIRIITLAVGDTIEATLSESLVEIESALHASAASAQLGNLIPAALRLSSVDIERDSEGERTVGRMTTTWTGTYYTYSNAPGTAAT